MNDRVPPLAAGWYPDPWGRYQYRYFNGTSWTADVAVDGQQRVDTPRPTTARRLAGARPAGSPAVPVAPSARPVHNVLANAALGVVAGSVLIGLIPYLFAVTVPAVVIALVMAVLGRRAARGLGGRGAGTALLAVALAPVAIGAAGLGLWFTRVLEHRAGRVQQVPVADIRIDRCDLADGQVTIAGRATNHRQAVARLRLTVIVHAASGGTEVIDFDSVRAEVGQTVPFTARHTSFATSVTCEIAVALWVT